MEACYFHVWVNALLQVRSTLVLYYIIWYLPSKGPVPGHRLFGYASRPVEGPWQVATRNDRDLLRVVDIKVMRYTLPIDMRTNDGAFLFSMRKVEVLIA